jgi:iron complex transport system ATP-binding protein
MENTIIEITRFSFSISSKVILKDISLSVKEGEYISIVGPNGAGKTTLLKCLDRIYKGGNGDIRIAGKPLDKYSQKELARKLSYVPQADGRISPFTVYEFVMMGRYPHLSPFSSPGKEDKDAVHDALTITGISEFAERFLRTLSGGERQKVFIAAALAQGAKVLLLDEPTTFLDPKHQADVHRLLERANRERGFTVVSVTHDINSAVLTSRRILALKNGAVAFCGFADKFMNNEILQKIYEKSFLFVKHPQTGKTIVAPEVP